MASTSPGRTWLPAVAACVLGAGLALAAAGQPWAHVETPALSVGQDGVTGRALAPIVAASALAALGAAAALLATRGALRRAVGGVVVLLGVAVVAGGLTASGDARVRAAADVGTGAAVRATAWPWASHVGGVLVLAAGILTLVGAQDWPGMSRRYDATSSGSARARPTASGPEDLWAALDRGDDPTADDQDDPGATRDPDRPGSGA